MLDFSYNIKWKQHLVTRFSGRSGVSNANLRCQESSHPSNVQFGNTPCLSFVWAHYPAAV